MFWLTQMAFNFEKRIVKTTKKTMLFFETTFLIKQNNFIFNWPIEFDDNDFSFLLKFNFLIKHILIAHWRFNSRLAF